MPLNQVQVPLVATTSAGVGIQNQAGGQFADSIVSELVGKYYYLTRAGLVYNLSTLVAGVAIPISTATAQTFMLWNPAGSTKNLVPLLLNFSYVAGTSVAGSIGISRLPNAGSAIGAAGAPISAFTETVPGNCLLGGGTGQVRGSLAATTIAATWFQTLGMTESALVGTTAMNPQLVQYDFQGSLIIPPNNAIVVVGSAATGATVSVSMIFAELPTT